MISLRGKIALITGGSRGIGLAIAKNFAAQGASTILVARDPARLHSAVAAVQAVYTAPAGAAADYKTDQPDVVPFHTGITGDVAQAATWALLCHQLQEGQLGRRLRHSTAPGGDDGSSSSKFLAHKVDVLVNCAGIAQNSLLTRTDPDKIAEILDTNLRSAVLGCRYLARTMIKSNEDRSRSIINVSSAMALNWGRGAAAYAASKAGLLGLTSALSLELAPLGVRVNALLPGYIETDMTAPLDQSRLRKLIPLTRLGKSEEVAHAAAFLAQNAYANNCVLTLDGGLSAGVRLPTE
ncbi:unnamed protein product [Discula destructiva]